METQTVTQTPTGKKTLVDMNWDPITRIVGSLGIYTKIDFNNREVAECYSTSSIFRGYSIFMKGKDPRDAHFITSRICGICGDNHATCACYAQNMAFGVRPPAMAEWIVNLGEAAEYMFDHNLYQDNLVGVDYCENMVKETNPSVWGKSQTYGRAECRSARLQKDFRHNDRAQSFYGRILPRNITGFSLHTRNVLPDGRSPRSSVNALSGRCRHSSDGSAFYRLSGSLDEIRRIYEKGRASATMIYSTSFMKRCRVTKRSGSGEFCSAAGVRSKTRMFAIINMKI